MIEKYILIFFLQIFLVICSSQNIQEINNICHKVDNKFTSKQITAIDFLKNYKYNFEKEKNYPKSDKLYEFLIGKKLEEEYDIEYIPVIKKYFLNLYLFPILLVWIIFGICFFMKKCIFKNDVKFNINSKLSTIIILIIFSLIFMSSISILGNIKKLQSSVNDSCCNLLKFFYELNHGKIKETNNDFKKDDRWPGLYTLNSILIDTSEAIIKISKKRNNTFSFLKEIKINVDQYQNLINSLIKNTSKGIPNPNHNEKEEIMPIYLYEFNNISKKNSIISDINSEYIKFFLNPFNQLNFIYNSSILLSEKSSLYDLSLNNVFENISDYCDFIKDKSSNITNNIIIFQRHSEFIIFFIKIVNTLCILLSIAVAVLDIMYYFKNILWIKISFHITWNFTFFLLILYICIYYFIFNLSDGVKHTIYLIEKKVLKAETNLFFNTCLNSENSDLNILLDIYNQNSALIEIDNYYKNVFPLIDTLTAMESELPKLEQVKRALNEVNKYLNNYELSTNSNYKNSDVTYILNDLSKITNSFKEGKDKGYCNSDDIWVPYKNKCKDHKYIIRYEIKNIFERKKNEKYCFLIQDDYKESDLKKIYGDVCSDKAYKQIVNYVTSLTKYYNNNEHLLETIEDKLKDLERYNKKLSELIISQVKKCENDLGDLIDIYKPILGNSNITDLFKCERLKKKIVNYYDISYNQITYYCKIIKIYIILIILFGLLGIVFIIVNNYRNHKEVKRRYMKLQNKDLNNDGVELIEEVPGEDEDN